MSLVYEDNHLCTDVIAHNARYFANSTAVVCEGDRLTWKELEARTNKVANAILSLGLRKGDKVALFMPNSIAHFELFWGVAKAGCVVVTLNTLLEGSALARLTNASEAKALFVDDSTLQMAESQRAHLSHIAPDRYFTVGTPLPGWRGSAALVEPFATTPPPVKVLASDSMTIIFTSGTTGVPKGIEHTHFGRLNYPLGFGIGLNINRYSVAVCSTPIYASGTWITMFPTMYRGGKVVLLPKYSPEAFLQAVATEGGTHSFMVPTQYIGLLQEDLGKYDTGSLQVLVTAGQSLSAVTYTQLLENFPSARICEIYGMTEGFSTLAIPGDIERGKRGTVGKPAFLEEIRIIDDAGVELPPGEVGEIVGYGPGMMKGYYGRPDLTAAATWISPEGRTFMRSGDLGMLDGDGFLYVRGRLKDMIKSGGINIYATDIEQVIMQHPAVSEVAVVGVPHEKWAETPVAAVLLKLEASESEASIMAWVNERLSKYQRLTGLYIRDSLPRTTYGKIQKIVLREQMLEFLKL